MITRIIMITRIVLRVIQN